MQPSAGLRAHLTTLREHTQASRSDNPGERIAVSKGRNSKDGQEGNRNKPNNIIGTPSMHAGQWTFFVVMFDCRVPCSQWQLPETL